MSGYRLLSLLAVALCAAALMGLGRWALAPEQDPLPDGPMAMARAADAEAPATEAKVDEVLLDQLWWGVYLHTIGTVYGAPRSDLIYAGEPFMVDLSLGNRTKAEIKLPRPFDAVVAESAWELARIINAEAKPVQVTVKAMRSDEYARTDVVPPEQAVELWVRLRDLQEPGKYRLTFTPPWGRLITRSVEFERVTARTKVEMMELHRRRALRSRWAGRSDDSERELRELLKLNPNSAEAYVQLSRLAELQERSAEAIEYLAKAIRLAEAGADKYDNLSAAHAREEWVHNLKARLKRLREAAAK